MKQPWIQVVTLFSKHQKWIFAPRKHKQVSWYLGNDQWTGKTSVPLSDNSKIVILHLRLISETDFNKLRVDRAWENESDAQLQGSTYITQCI